jgi:hypothetical protein
MRVVCCAGITAAAVLLASVASAQGLGDAAAREREKRKAAPATKAKVFTESDLGPASSTPVASEPTGEAPAATADAAQGAAKPGAKAEDPEKAAAEAAAKAQEEWRQKLDQARQEESSYQGAIIRLQTALNDTSTMYTPGWQAAMTQMEDAKKKLAEVQASIASMEEEGRRAGYR